MLCTQGRRKELSIVAQLLFSAIPVIVVVPFRILKNVLWGHLSGITDVHGGRIVTCTMNSSATIAKLVRGHKFCM